MKKALEVISNMFSKAANSLLGRILIGVLSIVVAQVFQMWAGEYLKDIGRYATAKLADAV